MNVYAAMKTISPWSRWSPYGMMWGGEAERTGTWLWLVITYHVVAALVVLLILILIAVLLWKKIQLMNHEEKRKR